MMIFIYLPVHESKTLQMFEKFRWKLHDIVIVYD